MNALSLKNGSLIINSSLDLHFATEEDSVFLKELYNDPKIQSFSLDEETMEITDKHVLATIESFQNSGYKFFVVNYDNTPIGMCMLYELSLKNKHSKIGLAFLNKYQNKGFGSVVLNFLSDYAFQELGLNKVFGEVYDYNHRSISLLNRLGFEKEAILKNHLFRKNKMIDVYIYSLFNTMGGEKNGR